MNPPLVIAHRGWSDIAPENTLVSFEKALTLDVPAMECDVHLTRDGHVVASRGVEQGVVLVGPGLVVVLEPRKLGIAEDPRQPPEPSAGAELELAARRTYPAAAPLRPGSVSPQPGIGDRGCGV